MKVKRKVIPELIEVYQWFPGKALEGVFTDGSGTYVVTFQEKRAYLKPGDYVFPESKPGRFYPVSPLVLNERYEIVEE